MPTFVLSLSPGSLTYVAEPAARSLVLACLAMIAVFVFRVRTVSWKTVVWRGVLFAALAMPLLGLFLPPILLPLPVLGKAYPATVTESEAPQTIPATRIVVVPPGAASFELQAAPAREPRSIPWLPILSGFYLAIAIGLLARIFVGAAFGNRLARHAIPVRDGGALRRLSVLARRAGLRVQPLLAESEILAVPVTLRVRRPAILLPASWNSWDAVKLSAVLAHEMSHIARRDAMVQRLALIHRAVFWFSPLGWWLVRYLDDLAEQACDEAALACGVDRTQYAETLLGFVAALQDCRARVWWQGVAMAKRGDAEKRLDRILAWRSAMPKKLRKSFLVGLAVLAVPVVALTASVHPFFFDFAQSTATPAPPPATPAAAPNPTNQVVANPGPALKALPGVPALPAWPALGSQPAVQPVGTPAPAPSPAVAPVMEQSAASQSRPSASPVAPTLSAPSVVNVGPVPRAPAIGPVAPFSPAAPVTAAITSAPPAATRVGVQAGGVSQGPQDGVTVGVSGEAPGGVSYGETYDSGPRFVIVTKGSDSVIMSGSGEDEEHAKSLSSKINGDFIWFERDEKPYVIRDQGTVQRAKQFWQPVEDLGRQQEVLGKQQEALGKQQAALGQQMQSVRIKVPNLSAEMEKVEAEMKQLSANGGTVEQIGDLQSEVGELQSRIGELQSRAGTQQSQIGREQGDLGRKQAELGRQQGELGRRQGELSRQASQQMKQLLEDAIAHDLAQAE